MARSWHQADGLQVVTTERLSLRDEEVPQKQDDDVVRKGARALLMLKITVAILVIISAIVLSSLTYVFVHEQESENYHSNFQEYSSHLILKFLQETQLKFWTSFSLSVAYTSETPPDAWPNAALSHFSIRTLGSATVSSSEAISFSPIVNEEYRESWEAFALDMQNPLFHEEARSRRLDAAVVPETYDLAEQHQKQQQQQREHQHLSEAHDEESIRELQSVHTEIYRLDDNGVKIPDPGPGPYVPICQVSPASNANSIMYNQMSNPVRKRTLSLLLDTERPQVSEILYPNSTEPSSVVYFPIGNGFDSRASIVGTTAVEFQWSDTFRHVFYDSATINVVLENSSGQVYTFMVQGPDVFFVGEGDLHDAKFDGIVAMTTYDDFLVHTAVNATLPDGNFFAGNRRQTQQESNCLYAIRIYPTQAFQNEYMTNKPVLYSVGVAMIFVFTSAVFLIYECLAGRQQGVVIDTLARSSAIVHSLFPANVRDRMLLDAERNMSVRRRRRASPLTDGLIRPPRFSYVHGDTPRKKLLSFLKGSRETYSKMEDSALKASTSDPIADYFPNTTVMFADIAGFTAWSSDREPSEVFHLLETVWSAFDAIAKRLGVFKIETVGDCYVCVTGLPDPNKDHALIMTRFAYECLHKMKQLTRKLEVTLGPGTTDLAMRFGLHSGPVTAGVLRGEKARFQLFGDTMNTAARMESTGQIHRIQVSQSTAALLKEAGKEHWFVPRENLVAAKGKGQLQTYWIKKGRLRTTEPLADTNGQPETSQVLHAVETNAAPDEYEFQKTPLARAESLRRRTANSAFTLESSIDSPILAANKNSRLIDWNVDILLGLLSKIVKKRERIMPEYTGGCVVEEVSKRPSSKEIASGNSRPFHIDDCVKLELHDFVSRIASFYRNVPFNNFEHASHVAMTANNLMKRIMDRDTDQPRKSTFGIRSDPLSHFAVVFSALVHDVNHQALTNGQVTGEIEEQKNASKPSSVELTWEMLMEPRYKHLRSCIYADAFERDRFRQFLINCIKATDVTDKELRKLRKIRWNAAFNSFLSPSTSLTPQEVNSRKATIVIELVMQTAGAAHYSQHWQNYTKWNELQFSEMYRSYLRGMSDKDPSLGWYENEILFFDNHVIPLTKMIKVCGVFAGSNEDCLKYAIQNRKEWEMKGRELCQEMLEKMAASERNDDVLKMVAESEMSDES